MSFVYLQNLQRNDKMLPNIFLDSVQKPPKKVKLTKNLDISVYNSTYKIIFAYNIFSLIQETERY